MPDFVEIAGIVSLNVEPRRAACRHAGRRHRAGTLQVFVGQRQRQGGDGKVIIAEAAAVCASRSRHIDEQDAIPGSEVVPESVEQPCIAGSAERQRDGTVIRLRDGQGTNGVAAHGGDAAGDAVFRGLVEREILCGISACRPEGHAHLYLRDGDVGKIQPRQTREVDRALIARG